MACFHLKLFSVWRCGGILFPNGSFAHTRCLSWRAIVSITSHLLNKVKWSGTIDNFVRAATFIFNASICMMYAENLKEMSSAHAHSPFGQKVLSNVQTELASCPHAPLLFVWKVFFDWCTKLSSYAHAIGFCSLNFLSNGYVSPLQIHKIPHTMVPTYKTYLFPFNTH